MKIEEYEADIEILLQVADIYVDAFGEEDRLTLTEALMLTQVRDIIAKYDRRQRCDICGTRWTADEKLPCPTPGKHGAPGTVLKREDYPELFAVVGDAYGEKNEGTFKLPDLRGKPATIVGADVTAPQPETTETGNPYKTSLDGHYWETGFCQNCSKVRYNTDNNHGLCGWCAEQLYPLES